MIRTVGNYKLLQELGEGAMGTVYRALDVQLEREVALKSLRSELARRPDIVDRFREEAKLQGKLENIHIVRLYQFLREGNEFFMVMEFVKGKTLSELLRERKRLPANEAVTIMDQALAGLGYAHKRNIVHRDIKPANIMINEDEIVKVADFGIARLVGSARQTKLGSIVGTLEYISPEAVQGNDASAVSDIYSCGILLYELLSGRLPFDSPNEYELARAQVKDKPPALRQFAPDVPARLEKAVMRALAKKPAERFQSAAQMAQELKSCIGQGGGAEPAQEKSFWNKLWSSSTPEADETQVLPGLQLSSPEPRRQSPLLESDDTSQRLRNTALQELSRQVDEYLNQRNWVRARQEVEKMTSLYPREPALVEMTNRITREQRHHDEALQMALREAQNLLDRGLPRDAKKAIELSLQRFHSEPDLSALLLRAEAELAVFAARSSEVNEVIVRVDQLLNEGRHPEAIAAAAEAVPRFPNQPEVTALLGRAVKSQKLEGCRQQVESFRKTSQWDAALLAIDQAQALYRDEPALVQLRQMVVEERECERQSKEAESVLANIAELNRGGRPDQAETAVNQAIVRLTKIPAPLAAQLVDASETFRKARHQKLAAEAIAEARGLEKQREWQRALDVLGKAISQAPDVPELEKIRGEIIQARDRYVTGLRKALADGRALLDASRFEDALVSLSASSQQYPGETGFTELLLEAQQKLTAERRERQLTAARAQAGELLRAESFDEAEQFLLDAISQFPEDARLADLLSSAIQGRREREKKRTVERAIASAKQYAGKKLYEDGIRALDEALAVYPGEPALEAEKRDLVETLRQARRVELVRELRGWAKSHGAGNFDAARASVGAALAEYPDDPELTAIHAEIDTAQRAFNRASTEGDIAARSAELEGRGQFDQALGLIDEALGKYPESASLAALKTEVARRREEAARLRQAGEAEREIRRLLALENPHAAVQPMNAALKQFPEHPAIQKLEPEVAARVREFDTANAARLMREALANRDWSTAENAVRDLEKVYGSDPAASGLSNEIKQAKQARKKSLDEAAGRVRSQLASGEFVNAITLIESLSLATGESQPFDELLARARAGLETQVFQNKFQALRDKVSSALERGEVEAALQSLAEAQAEFEKYPAFRELEAKARRERDIRAALDHALEQVGARQWAQAIAFLESKAKELGKDRRFQDLIAQIQEERKARHQQAEAALSDARAFFEAGHHERAIQRLTQAVVDFPEEPAVAEALEKAREQHAASVRKAQVREIENRARALLTGGKPQDAEVLLGKAVDEFKGEASLESLLAEARAARSRLDEIRSRVDSVQGALKASDPARAQSLLDAALEKFPDEPALVKLQSAVSEAALIGTLNAGRREFSAGHIEAAKSTLAAAIEKYGQEPRLTAFGKEIEEAEHRKATIERTIGVGTAYLDAGKIQDALAILEKLPAWVANDPATVEFRERCQRMLAWQKEELQKITARVEALCQKGLYDDAVTLLESASSEPHLQPVLHVLLERCRKIQLSVAQQLSNARQARAQLGASAALELIRKAGPETRVHPDFVGLREQYEREARELSAPTRVTPIPIPAPPTRLTPVPIQAPPPTVEVKQADVKPTVIAPILRPIPEPRRKFPPAVLWGGGAFVALAVALLVKSLVFPSTPAQHPATTTVAPPSGAAPSQPKPPDDQPNPTPAKTETLVLGNLVVAPRQILVDYQIPNPFPPPYKFSVTSTSTPIAFTASVSKGSEWLSITQDSSSTPATLLATVKPLKLKAGSYEGAIRCSSGTGRSATIAVNLTIHPFSIK